MNEAMRRALIILCVIVLVSVGALYAYTTAEITFTNKYQSGSTDIDIEQYHLVNGKEELMTHQIVVPDMKVSYIPRVTNLRADGYVRVKVDIIMDEEVPRPVTLNDVYGINIKDWILKGDYFYCTHIMTKDEQSDVFAGIHIPAEWSQVSACGFSVHCTADVIQSDNFTPNFESELPWGGVEIEVAKETDEIDYNTVQEIGDKDLCMTYTKGKTLEGTTEDLFENFVYYMAGDVYKDSLKMKNDSENKITVFFQTKTARTDMNEQMDLNIICDGKELYDGDLVSKDLEGWRELTDINPGETKDFDFEVKLPEESKNYYSVLNDEVIWQFKVVEDEKANEKTHQTGDSERITFLAIMGLIAALGLIALLFTEGKKRRE